MFSGSQQQRALGAWLVVILLFAAQPVHAKRLGGGRNVGSHHTESHPTPAPRDTDPVHDGAASGASAGDGISIRPRVYVDGSSAAAVMEPDEDWQRQQGGALVQQPRRSSMMWGWWLALAVPITLLVVRYRKYRSRGNREQEFAQAMLAAHVAERPRTPAAAVASAAVAAPAPEAVAGGLADGGDVTALLRQMRASFMHLRTLNQALNGEQVRNYLSPALAARLLPKLPKNAEQVKFPVLKCDLLDSSAEGGGYRAQLRFSGSMRLTATGPVFEFGEIWHLRKSSAIDGWQVEDIVRDDPPA